MRQLRFDDLMDDASGSIARALEAAGEFLDGTPTSELLPLVGKRIGSIPAALHPDKRWFQQSFGRSATNTGGDLLAGRGLFYVTEDGCLYLDCTAGHYQMTWGYGHPELQALARDCMNRGIVWDNHSNIPSGPVKRLAARLVQIANGTGRPLEGLQGDGQALNTVLLGVCTGTVACGAAMKVALAHYAAHKGLEDAPVFVVLDGNYHGTDFLCQRLRGMWPEYFTNLTVAAVQPNDCEELQSTFERHGERVAGFWAEPIMMNREAIALERDYLALARRLCDDTGALMIIDEIQTAFWCPEVMMFRRHGIEPDILVLGKGLTAGFHPLAALLYRGDLDRLAQYDAISTNGNAALAACLGLGCIALVEREAGRIGEVARHYHEAMSGLCAEFPDLLVGVRGAGHLTGLKFRRRQDALGFHRSAVERGMWVRAHAYHEGHSTVLTKFALPLDREVADFTVDAFRQLLEETPWKRP